MRGQLHPAVLDTMATTEYTTHISSTEHMGEHIKKSRASGAGR
jgi:hypothetical protein